jgi:hypothetical protein
LSERDYGRFRSTHDGESFRERRELQVLRAELLASGGELLRQVPLTSSEEGRREQRHGKRGDGENAPERRPWKTRTPASLELNGK